MPLLSEQIELSTEDVRGPWAAELRRVCEFGLKRAQERLGLELDAKARVESIAPEDAFYRLLGSRPHNIAAVAIAHENRVVVNRQVFLASSRREREETLTHEFAHLILGRRVPGGLPSWLGEGLAMVTAEETSIIYHSRLAVAASFGGLIPLTDLWRRSPAETVDQTLAYAQSLSATRYLIKTGVRGSLGTGDDPKPLARRLADRIGGAPLRELLRDPGYVRAFERRWKASIRTFWTWIAALSGGGVLWGAASLLFLVAYWRKKRMARMTEERWRDEEEAFPYLE